MTTSEVGPRDALPEMLIITGMSGAGRVTTAHMLEDLGWFVVDNLPPQMIVPLAQLTAKGGATMPKVAVVVDVRGGEHFKYLRQAVERAEAVGIHPKVLFLDAADSALVRRFESVRRPHPLQSDGLITDGIRAERELLHDIRGNADLVLDTSDLNVHQLSARVSEVFSTRERSVLRLNIMSFGFKYGLPMDADHVADVRFLPNPYWVPELKGHNGTEKVVQDYVGAQEGAAEFLERYVSMLEPVIAGYLREKRAYATIAVGCTGGKHRSVATALALGESITHEDVNVKVSHRDLGRE